MFLTFMLLSVLLNECVAQIANTQNFLFTSRNVWANSSQAFADAVRGLLEGEELTIHLPPGQFISMSDPGLILSPASLPATSSRILIVGSPQSPAHIHLGYLSSFTVSVYLNGSCSCTFARAVRARISSTFAQ